MSKSDLAYFGGKKTIDKPLKRYNSIGKEEMAAVQSVIASGVLSSYVASWGNDFLGGPQVQQLEAEAQRLFNVEHAIAVNSWTSGLICAIGALDVSPGDEIIVTPWTMSATVAAILHWGCIPIFADIDVNTFMLDSHSVENKITEKTKAILSADIFGQSDNYFALRKLADAHNLKIVSDTAQAPLAHTKHGFAGTISDIGGISLNYHKHIHCGEGGIIFTKDAELALRMKLIRNHAESCVGDAGLTNLGNMIGYNFRLGEMESAIAREQLKKLPKIVKRRQEIADKITRNLCSYDGLKVPKPVSGNEHVYYVYPILIDTAKLRIGREEIVELLEAEGVEGMMKGYVNCHLLPGLVNKTAYGSKGFPWSLNPDVEYSYGKGLCPVAEELHNNTFLGFEMCMLELEEEELDLIIAALKKVFDYSAKYA